MIQYINVFPTNQSELIGQIKSVFSTVAPQLSGYHIWHFVSNLSLPECPQVVAIVTSISPWLPLPEPAPSMFTQPQRDLSLSALQQWLSYFHCDTHQDPLMSITLAIISIIHINSVEIQQKTWDKNCVKFGMFPLTMMKSEQRCGQWKLDRWLSKVSMSTCDSMVHWSTNTVN